MLTSSIGNLSVLEYCERGQFEQAASVLPGWRGIGLRPTRQGETDREYADYLQWAAVISVELGLKNQIAIGDGARDMLTESARLSGTVEPLVWLGICYHKSGEYDEAEAMLRSCLDHEMEPASRFLALRNLAAVKTSQGCHQEALDILVAAESLIAIAPIIGRGKFYLQRGLIFRRLNRLDEAISEYAQADACFEEADSQGHEAAVSVNMARVFSEQGRYLKAHVSAERAVSLFMTLGDKWSCAKAWDEIAHIYLAEGKLENAERAARQALTLIEGGEQEQVIAECLITHGVILGRLGVANSVTALTRAVEICTRIGDKAQLVQANKELMHMVRTCRHLVTEINEAMRPIEHQLIKDALTRNGGIVARAAKDLGLHINTLNKKIKEQFPDLLDDRRPVLPRRKGIIKHLGVKSDKLTTRAI